VECPKCKSEMEFGILNQIKVERCPQCMGIWFNESDHKLLKKVKGSELIDVGPVELGQEFDGAVYVPCPICGEAMHRVSEKGQSHITYEACADGHGVFFDAGEYKDYKEKSLGDIFKRIF
jgi:uncharacterized protein